MAGVASFEENDTVTIPGAEYAQWFATDGRHRDQYAIRAVADRGDSWCEEFASVKWRKV
jgi:hypothetical protein